MTYRSERPDAYVRLKPDSAQLTFPLACCSNFDPCDTKLVIREAGSCPEDEQWLVAYPFREMDSRGRASFRIDGALHNLCPGLYDGVIFVGCDECGTVRIDTTKTRPFAMEALDQVALQEIPDAAPPLDGRDTVYDPYVGFTATLTCDITAVGQLIRFDSELPSPTPSPAPQLVLRDGVNTETVQLISATDGSMFVERGATAYAFNKGTTVQFEWTTDNILSAAAGPDQTLTPKGSEADPATTGGESTVSDDDDVSGSKCLSFEAGKGITINQNELGTIVVGLDTTGVVAGEHNGITLDDCGRVTAIDASFPDIPVFDGCCKEEAGE